MSLRVVCSGYLLRYPLGGMTWHHAQYLLGLQRLGADVTYFEDYGWPNSCYDPDRNEMTSDPQYGIAYWQEFLRTLGVELQWCYLAEDGTAFGITREELAAQCEASDLYLNLSNINWIPELEQCRRRVLIDTDPVFTQIGGHGLGGAFTNYHTLFTYGENVQRTDCSMPTAGVNWLPTRQPVVLDLWPVTEGNKNAPLTTVMNWSAYGESEFEGKVYGQKDREFAPYFALPKETGEAMEIALNAPPEVRAQLETGGWRLSDPKAITRTPFTYQTYLQQSRGEFSVAKHAYVTTRSGWFSDRSTGYLASGRPVVVQDTGWQGLSTTAQGLLTFQTHGEAVIQLQRLHQDYDAHCRAARSLAEKYFDAQKVLSDLLARCW
ncbi:MAG: hypothetical protein U0Y68_00395 [Blastocatellia bacterium]